VVIVPVVSPGGRVPVGPVTVVVGAGVVTVTAGGAAGAGVVSVGVGAVCVGVVVIVGGVVDSGGSTTGGGVVVVVVVAGIEGEVWVTVRPGGVVTVVVVVPGSVDVGVVAGVGVVGVVGTVAVGPVGVVAVEVVSAGVEVVGPVFSLVAPSSLEVWPPVCAWCARTTVEGASERGTVGATGGAEATAGEEVTGCGVTWATALDAAGAG
jgi:hypothetical protein